MSYEGDVENIITKSEEDAKKHRFFNRCMKSIFPWHRNEKPLTAQEAYFRTKYGDITSLDEYITVAQNHIALEIKRCISPNLYANANEDKLHSYYAMVDFDEDMVPYVDEIFKPFRDNGFKFIPLHDRIEEVNNASVWLISWDKRRKLER